MPLGIQHSRFLAWSEDDQDKALAFVRAKRELCSECATREADWKEDRFAFVSNTRRCLGCEAIELERKNIPDDAKGVKVFLEPRWVAEARDAEEEGDG